MAEKVKIEILGIGCKKCQLPEAHAKEAVALHGLDAEVVHITDMMEIVKRGVMPTPAPLVDGEVICQGKVLSAREIAPRLP